MQVKRTTTTTMTTTTLLLTAAAYLITCLPASASPVEVQVTFTGPSTTINDGHYYVGPYNLNIDETTTTGVCVTYDIEIYSGETWTATVNPISASPLPQQVMYREEGWLAGQFFAADPGEWVGIAHAIWNLGGADYTDAGAGYWIGQAGANYGTVDGSGWMVVTPVVDGAAQTMIVQVTPEPGTIGLMMIVLGVVG